MRFTISGEELQLSTSRTTDAPVTSVFTPVSEAFKPALVQQLEEYGIVTADGDRYSQALIPEASSIRLETNNTLGKVITTTYLALPTNTITQKVPYLASFGIEDTFHFDVPEFDLYSLADALPNALEGALSGVASCLGEGAGSIIKDLTDEFVDTAIGVVRKTAYGAAGKIMDSIGLEKGGILWTTGRDCLVTGMATAGDVLLTAGGADVFNVDSAGNKSTPDIQSVLDAARKVGQKTVAGLTGSAGVGPGKVGTLTKITKSSSVITRGSAGV
jgi:hypothetical protein